MAVDKAETFRRKEFLKKICHAFLLFGAPTHQIAEVIATASKVLHVNAHFLSMPFNLVLAFGSKANDASEVYILKVEPMMEMGRLIDVFSLYTDLVDENIEFKEAARRLDAIMDEKLRFSLWTVALVYGLGSACVAPLAFRAGFLDLPVIVVLACFVGVLEAKWMAIDPHFIPLFEILAGAVVAFSARAIGSLHNGELFCFGSIALSSIVFALPGFLVLSSCVELQTSQIVTGSFRLLGAIANLLYLGFGLAMGTYMYGFIDSNATSQIYCKAPPNPVWYILFAPGYIFCQCVVRQAKWTQFPPTMVISIIGFYVNLYFGALFGGSSLIPGMVGSFTVGILSSVYTSLYRPAKIVLLCFKSVLALKTQRGFCATRDSVGPRRWSHTTLLTGDTEAGQRSHIRTDHTDRRRTLMVATVLMIQTALIQAPTSFSIRGFLEAGSAMTGSAWGLENEIRQGIESQNLDVTFFSAFLHVIQGIIGICFGLLFSSSVMYPFSGKPRTRID